MRELKKRNRTKERRVMTCREDSERAGAGREVRWVSAEVTTQVPP